MDPSPGTSLPHQYAELVDYAWKLWDAEVQNATRLENKSKINLAVLSVLLGLGWFHIAWYYDPGHKPVVASPYAVAAIKSLLISALIVFGWAFFRVPRQAYTAWETTKNLGRVGATIISAIMVMAGGAILLVRHHYGEDLGSSVYIGGLLLILFGLLNLNAIYHIINGRQDDSDPPDRDGPAFSSHYLHLSPAIIHAAEAPDKDVDQLLYYSN